MAERLIINLSTGEETTVALTAEEIAADNAVATEIAKTKYILWAQNVNCWTRFLNFPPLRVVGFQSP